jgi:hypothetical protein
MIHALVWIPIKRGLATFRMKQGTERSQLGKEGDFCMERSRFKRDFQEGLMDEFGTLFSVFLFNSVRWVGEIVPFYDLSSI